MSEEQKTEWNTIESYIKNKDKLLSVFAIFIALTLFSHDKSFIKEDLTANYRPFEIDLLSFIFFSISILIWMELWVSFPKKNVSFSLQAFKFLIDIGTTYLIMLWLNHYLKKGMGIIFLSVTILFVRGLRLLISKLDLHPHGTKKNKRLVRVMAFSIQFLIILISILAAGGIVYLLNLLIS